MTTHKINVIKDFNPKPYGRYPSHSDYCGENFRKQLLAPALKEFDFVQVELTGYNRYGRSFIDEAFGGLVRDENWSETALREKLEIIHEELPSLIELAWNRIKIAQSSKETT